MICQESVYVHGICPIAMQIIGSITKRSKGNNSMGTYAKRSCQFHQVSVAQLVRASVS